MFLRFVSVLLVLIVTSCKSDVDVKWMNDTLASYFSQTRHHVTNPENKARTMRFIRDQFRQVGLETHVHTFATQIVNVTGVNVIGVLRGRYFNTPQDKVVGIGAHYDTMRNTPGVDDNGAAVVTMLQAAREITRQPSRNYTVIFIAFDFEEWEEQNVIGAACSWPSYLCGSMNLVKQWIPSFWTQPVGWRGIFIMDTIMNFNSQQQSQQFPQGIDQVFPSEAKDIQSDGGRGDFLLAAGREVVDQDLLDTFKSTWNQQGQPQFETETFKLPSNMAQGYDNNFVRSDHLSFWMHGYSALFITDTADLRGYMVDCYHKPCDTLQNVTPNMINFAAKTADTLIALVNHYSPVVDATSASGGLSLSGFCICIYAILALTMCRQRVI